MPSVVEALAGKSQLAGVLAEGVNVLSDTQTITFTKYLRVVLPLDGFVFWVNSQIVNQGAVNTATLNSTVIDATGTTAPATLDLTVGSLHYATTRGQNEDETIDINRIVFTALQEIDEFNLIAPTEMYLGAWDGIRFSVSARQSFYKQGRLYHYIGDAVYPEMETQIIDSVDSFDTQNIVVSNSLPIWLAFNVMVPTFPYPGSQHIPLYPSFAVPANLEPPYGAVHIEPSSQRALQAAPIIDGTMTHNQLVAERVKITLYGLRNFNVLDFIDYVNNQSLLYDSAFGIVNMPIPRDEKRTQVEMGVLAMKKSLEFEINYYQSRTRAIAVQLILSVIPSYIIGD